MKRFAVGLLSLAGSILCVSISASAATLDLLQIPPVADAVCGDDASLLKWVLGVVALPVAASILANFRSRLPPSLAAMLDAIALNFVKVTKTTPPAVAAALLFLTGCTTSQQAAVSGFEATALKGAQSAEDNNILVWKTDACGSPFSAVVRNAQTVPGLVPALSALCVPNADKGNPNDLLKAAPGTAP